MFRKSFHVFFNQNMMMMMIIFFLLLLLLSNIYKDSVRGAISREREREKGGCIVDSLSACVHIIYIPIRETYHL
jgi:hypothetical protein